MSKSAQRGFTLIELVVVIVILGILAAFAVPRFSRLDQQARIASVRSLEGTLRAASTMARAQWLAQGSPATINMEGGTIRFNNGYPTRATILNTLAPGTVQAGVPGRFSYVAGTGVFSLNGAPGANCTVTYTEPANINSPPTVAVPAQATLNASC